MNLKYHLKELYNIHIRYEKEISNFSDIISKYIEDLPEDGFSVLYQPSDGFVLEINSDNYLIMDVINLIEVKGTIKIRELKRFGI